MKVLFQSRVDLYNPRGGDTAQMEHTKKAIEAEDPTIDIDISIESKVKNIEDYDIVHLFNLDWIPETYVQAKWAKKHNKKVVLSAIHHSEKEVLKFEEKAAYDIRKIYNFFFRKQAGRDVGKNVYRSIFNLRKLKPTLTQIFTGIRNSQKSVIEMSDVVLVQTNKEVEDIKEDFNIEKFEWKKIVNGVDISLFDGANPTGFDDYVISNHSTDIKDNPIILSVGRIEPRKNQLALIKVFKELKKDDAFKDHKLVFIGALTQRSFEYVKKFKAEVDSDKDIIYTGALTQDLVASAMAHKGLYVHTSWFETTGLVTLEASLAGMSVVATGERTKEYLGEYAYYCEPDNLDSIKNAIINAVKTPVDISVIQKSIKSKYSWENTANETIEVYKNLLNK